MVRPIIVATLICVSCLFIPTKSQAQISGEVIAEINGGNITRADLEKAEGGKLLQARYQVYLAERKALEQLIDDRVVELEAAAQHITVDELIAREVTAKVVDPSDDQLRIYYDDLGIKEPFDEVRGKIIEHVRQVRSAKLRAAYIEQLRTNSKIITTLSPPRVDVAISNAPRLGDANAPVKIVEFADYECPYCAKVNPHLRKLRDEFGSQLSIYFKDMPLPMHAHSQKAAEAARCAGAENKYWEYHDVLFNQRQLDLEQLKKYAQTLNLDQAKFNQCLEKGEQADAVKKDIAEAQQLGITGTPSFFINGSFISGAVEYNTLRDIVRQQLSTVPQQANAGSGK